jgi:hypothetical protein
MAERREEPRGRGGTTPRQPTVPPAEYLGHEHSFTLQMVTQLHGSVGELKAEVRGLLKQAETQETKLDKISHQISNARAVIIVVSILISGCLGVFAFLANKLWDLAVKHLGG